MRTLQTFLHQRSRTIDYHSTLCMEQTADESWVALNLIKQLQCCRRCCAGVCAVDRITT